MLRGLSQKDAGRRVCPILWLGGVQCVCVWALMFGALEFVPRPFPGVTPCRKPRPKASLRKVYRLEEYSREDWSALDSKVVGPEAPLFPPVRSSDLRLQLEYLGATIHANEYYSLPVADAVGGEHKFFLVLRKRTAARKRVRTLRGPGEAPLQLEILVQHLGVSGPADGATVHVFPDSDPTTMEALKLGPIRALVHHMCSWTAEPSCVEGCVALVNRQRAVPSAILDEEKPTLSLISSLVSAGWRPVRRAIVHLPGGNDGREFDVENAASKKKYYLCLLKLENIFAGGVAELPSNEVQKYYQALLEGHKVLPGLGDAAYRFVLSGGVADLPALPPSSPAAALPPPAIADLASDASDEVLGAGERPLGVACGTLGAPLPAPSPAARQSSSSSSGAQSSNSSDEVLDAVCPTDVAVELPPLVEGAKVRVEDRRDKWKYIRYILTCAEHPACMKHRNMNARQVANFGAWEPIGYLAVWHSRRREYATAEEHVKLCKPTIAEVRAWLVANGRLSG